MIPEYQFDHCIYQLQPENMANDPVTQMQEIYARCVHFLRLQSRPNLGVTVIISPRWFFCAILTQPYANAPNGNPVYLDGFDFAGMLSMQRTADTWPATAGLEDQTISIAEALSKSTQETKIADDDEDKENSFPSGTIHNESL